MQFIYDRTEIFDISDEAIEGLRTFAISIMDAARKAEPEVDHCWNVCLIEIDSISPSFCYGERLEDVFVQTKNPQQVLVVYHPQQLSRKGKS